MKQLMLCGKYPLPLGDFTGNPTHKSGARDTSYRAYLNDDHGISEISKAAASYLMMIEAYEAIMGWRAERIVDYFGGIGVSATLASYELDYESFYIHETDQQLAAHLASLGHKFIVSTTSAWDAIMVQGYPRSDLVIFDPQLFFGADWVEHPYAGDLLKANHKAIIATDVTPYLYHIPANRIAHTRHICLAFVPDEIEEYFHDLNHWMLDRGYWIAKTVYWGACAKHLLIRTDLANGYHMIERMPHKSATGYGHIPATTVEDV